MESEEKEIEGKIIPHKAQKMLSDEGMYVTLGSYRNFKLSKIHGKRSSKEVFNEKVENSSSQ